MSKTPKIIVAKPGLDGHDRGAKVVARALRDAGMEVIYMGLHNLPQQVVECVLQEDADAIGLSILSGAHRSIVPRINQQLIEKGMGNVPIIVGGIIPDEDIQFLKDNGVQAVFTPGANLNDIIAAFKEAVAVRHQK